MYTEYQPCSLLSPFIDKYWVFEGSPEFGMRFKILPDGCTDFIFSIGEVANPVERSQMLMQPYRSYFVGPMTKYSELITSTRTIHMLGIRFLASGLAFFTNFPLYELANQRINTIDGLTLFDNFFAETLCEMPDIQARIFLIEKHLTNYLHKNYNPVDKQIISAVNYITQSQGRLPIQRLMDQICICQRHFERKFRNNTGFTPKEYSRIMKFRNALNLLKSTHYDNLLSIAIESGYYDLPHFSKEIKHLSGSTPYTLLSEPMPENTTLTYSE